MDELSLLSARVLAIRDVVAQLVAFEALRSPNSKDVYQEIADGTAKSIYAQDVRYRREGREAAPEAVAFQEEIQKQVDWIVEAARRIALP